MIRHFSLLILTVFLSISCNSTEPLPAKSDKIIVAYVTQRDKLPNPAYMTHINFAFGHVNKTFDGIAFGAGEYLNKIVALKVQNPDLKVLLSIGGWGAGRFSEMAFTDSTRKSFAKDCRRIVDEYQLDGIDMDWEYPSNSSSGISSAPEDIDNFTLLMRDIREAIGEDKLLTLATIADGKYVDFKGIDPYIDFINVMEYDVSRPPYHHSPLWRSEHSGRITADEAIKAHVAAGAPIEKLVLGLPFYGHGKDGLPDYVNYSDIINLKGYKRYWDYVAKVPYMTNDTGKLVLCYEDPASITEKWKYVYDNNIKGTMYWEYWCDTEDLTLTKAVYEGLFRDEKTVDEPSPFGFLPEYEALNKDSMAVRFGADWEKMFKHNLSTKAKVTASATRGMSVNKAAGAKYSPAMLVDSDPDTYWATDDNVTTAAITFEFRKERNVNMVVLSEDIHFGLRVRNFNIEYQQGKEWIEVAHGTSIGQQMIVEFPVVKAKKVRVNILASDASPVLSTIELYYDEKRWEQTWADDFNGSAVDWNTWSKVPRERPDWKNYMADDDSLIVVRDGKLVLRGVNNGTRQNDTAAFLTGGIWGKDKKDFGYGRLDIKARLGCATGFWPAIWLLPQDGKGWPEGGEIDIMEHLNRDSIVYQTVHSYYTLDLGIRTNPKSSTTAKYNPGEFNVFSVERHRDSVVFYVNNERTLCYPKIETDKPNQYPFDKYNFYLILSAQLGGGWVGAVNPADLPVEMEIDWVKFSELKRK